MSILSAVGNTPLVELNSLNSKKPEVRIFGKLEGSNPGGSVKDRTAYWMIKNAEQSGRLTKGKIILEPTSRNTGIALAMIGAAKGYKVTLCMPECVSTEWQHVLQALNAEENSEVSRQLNFISCLYICRIISSCTCPSIDLQPEYGLPSP